MLSNLKLRFDDNKNDSFRSMCGSLSILLSRLFPRQIFYIDAEEECLSRFSSSFLGPTNRINGWLIAKDEQDDFHDQFFSRIIDPHWDNSQLTIWAYFDGERTGEWLFSFKGPVFER